MRIGNHATTTTAVATFADLGPDGDDVMLTVGRGIYWHARINTIFVVLDRLTVDATKPNEPTYVLRRSTQGMSSLPLELV